MNVGVILTLNPLLLVTFILDDSRELNHQHEKRLNLAVGKHDMNNVYVPHCRQWNGKPHNIDVMDFDQALNRFPRSFIITSQIHSKHKNKHCNSSSLKNSAFSSSGSSGMQTAEPCCRLCYMTSTHPHTPQNK